MQERRSIEVSRPSAVQTRLKWYRGNSIHRMSIDKLNIRTVGLSTLNPHSKFNNFFSWEYHSLHTMLTLALDASLFAAYLQVNGLTCILGRIGWSSICCEDPKIYQGTHMSESGNINVIGLASWKHLYPRPNADADKDGAHSG